MFTFVSCFQFGYLQLCIHLCHQCIYPHIPVPGSHCKPVAVCIMTAFSLLLSSAFSQLKLISRCALLYKNPLSLFLSRSPSSCQLHSSLSLTLCISLSWFLYYSLSLFPSLHQTYQKASVWVDVHSWLLSQLTLAAFALSLFFFYLFCSLPLPPPTVFSSFRWSSTSCFCCKCFFFYFCRCMCCTHHRTPNTHAHSETRTHTTLDMTA